MKIKILFLLILLSFSSSFLIVAQGVDIDVKYIDKELKECLNEHPTTQGSADCIIKATAEWDKILNKYYNLLKDALSDDGKQNLLDAQRAWIKMRDKEFALIDQIYHVETGGGTMYIPMALNAKMEIVQRRAMELQTYYDMISTGY